MMPATSTRPLRILSRAIFFPGVILGLVLSGIAIWNHLEATSYFFTGVKYAPFPGLRCPVMIAPTEKGIVSAIFDNPTNEEDAFFYRVEISGKVFSRRQVEDQIAVSPHQTKTIRLAVDANDVDLMFFIFVKISILPNSVHRSQEAVCGMMVANILGLTGPQISTAALFLSFLGMAIGLGMWQQTITKADRDIRRVVPTLGFVVLLTMFAASMGWWMVAIALSVVTILLMVISLRFAIA
jgi:hypothetical protein